jgi:hypothetical protein
MPLNKSNGQAAASKQQTKLPPLKASANPKSTKAAGAPPTQKKAVAPAGKASQDKPTRSQSEADKEYEALKSAVLEVRAGQKASQVSIRTGIQKHILSRRSSALNELCLGNDNPSQQQIKDALMPPIGRPIVFSDGVLLKVKAAVETSAFRGSSIKNITSGSANKTQLAANSPKLSNSVLGVLEEERKKEKNEAHPNGFAPTFMSRPMSKRTVDRAIVSMDIQRKHAEWSNLRRFFTLNDVKNPISLAACLLALHNEIPGVSLGEGVLRK